MRSVWSQETISTWFAVDGGVHFKPLLRQKYALQCFCLVVSHRSMYIVDDITFDILRGLQGIGRAAMMPAAVMTMIDVIILSADC